MADNKEKNEDLKPAMLAEGEAIIPEYVAESAKKLVEQYSKSKEAVEQKIEGEVISSPEPVADGKPSITHNKDGIISSGKTAAKPKEKAVKVKEEKKVALYSTRNVHWYGVGKVVKGYNFVSEAESKKWLERDHIRLVQPEEVKKEFDN